MSRLSSGLLQLQQRFQPITINYSGLDAVFNPIFNQRTFAFGSRPSATFQPTKACHDLHFTAADKQSLPTSRWAVITNMLQNCRNSISTHLNAHAFHNQIALISTHLIRPIFRIVSGFGGSSGDLIFQPFKPLRQFFLKRLLIHKRSADKGSLIDDLRRIKIKDNGI
jgi:hypothetical protein